MGGEGPTSGTKVVGGVYIIKYVQGKGIEGSGGEGAGGTSVGTGEVGIRGEGTGGGEGVGEGIGEKIEVSSGTGWK